MEKKSFAQNAFACILASIVIGGSSVRIANRFFTNGVSPIVFAVVAVVALSASIIFSVVWYRKERRGTIDSRRTLAWFQGLLRYGIALELCLIGWQKIFHLQFITPIARLDNPFNSLSLIDHMWAFFGLSYSFIVVIGLIQILGSVLLLFSRTRLVGVFILIPVLLNIILIDFFYEIEPGPMAQAIILFSGVMYFLLIEYDRLKTFFFNSKSELPTIQFKSHAFKNLLRLAVVIVPLVVILTNKRLAPYVYSKTQLPKGRYEVKQLLMNDKNIDVRDCRDSVITMVFIEHDIVFQYHDVSKRLFGEYIYDDQTKQIRAVWHYPFNRNDTLQATVTRKENEWIFDGKMGTNKVRMELLKTDPPKYP
ncbi:MAG: hypothetical protein WDO14_24390 [Bacteroidota bacterium]